MRQILMNPGGVVVAHVPRPIVARGTVLVRVHYSVVSVGTEIAPLRPVASADSSSAERAVAYAALARRYARASIRDPRKAIGRLSRIAARQVRRLVPLALNEPAASVADGPVWNIGYSAAGEVVAVGEGITDLSAGDFVACAGAGQANHADYIVVHRNLVCRVPPGTDLKSAASATIGAIAMQGVRRAAPQLAERVCVIGLGLIGQLTAQLLKAAGCDVIGFDPDQHRVARATALGMTHGESALEPFKALVRDVTGGRGVDQTLMTAATKSSSVINLAMDVTRLKGRVVIVGDVGLNVERETFYRKEIDLLMSTSYGPGRYDPTYEIEGRDYPFGYVRWTENRNMQAYLELVARGQVDVARLMDRIIHVDDAPATYQAMAAGEGDVPIGVLIDYTAGAPADELAEVAMKRPRHASPSGRIRYALVGPGSFASNVLVPQMERSERFELTAAVTRDQARGSNFARDHRVAAVVADLDAVLSDDGIDLVVISTRHHEHANQVIRSLNAGKHVFVEKPLALSWDELSQIVAAYESLENPPLLMVGFNRRFSPALQALAAQLTGRRSPLMIQYRVNAGYLPAGHWVHGPQGGGRNIGEACHMYDVFRFLSGAAVRSIAATPIDPGSLPYFRNDNFSATLAYEDGTVASLLYTALGPGVGMGKEHITVFYDGSALVVDDFRTLTRPSDSPTLWQSSEIRKGHFEELNRFAEAIAIGGEAPIPFKELVETTAVALHVEDLLFGRDSDEPK